MGLNRMRPPPSGRMGILWTLSTMKNTALLEFGSMGHMVYADTLLERMDAVPGCKRHVTHIDETDISLGRTDRLYGAVREVIHAEGPEAIFLLPSALPEMTGVDLGAVCEELQAEFPETPILSFPRGGFQYGMAEGMEAALERLVQKLSVQQGPVEENSYNIIGSCVDLYRFRPDEEELTRLLAGAFGAKKLCSLAADAPVEKIRGMGSAKVNLVIRHEGIRAAIWLEKTYGTPWLFCRPYGWKQTLGWLQEVAELLGQKADTSFLQSEKELFRHVLSVSADLLRYRGTQTVLYLGGHADVVRGIRNFALKEAQFPVKCCWQDNPGLRDADIPFFTEEQRMQAVRDGENDILMADGEFMKLWTGRKAYQIAWPGSCWEISPYASPFLGIRGAMHLLSLWVNS